MDYIYETAAILYERWAERIEFGVLYDLKYSAGQ